MTGDLIVLEEMRGWRISLKWRQVAQIVLMELRMHLPYLACLTCLLFRSSTCPTWDHGCVSPSQGVTMLARERQTPNFINFHLKFKNINRKTRKIMFSTDNRSQRESYTQDDFIDNSTLTKKTKLAILPVPPEGSATIEYREFILDKIPYRLGDCVEVMGPHGKDAKSYIGEIKRIESLPKDNRNVWITVQWYYWGDEIVGGKKPWHGKWEMLKTDHLDIVHVTSVICKTPVTWYDEDGDDGAPENCFWRQCTFF
jgi:hypothetical protein